MGYAEQYASNEKLIEDSNRLKEATEILKQVNAFGFSHYEDCPKFSCDEDACECCDCGMTKLESDIETFLRE